MKLTSLLTVALAALLFLSCQKEIDGSSMLSRGTLKESLSGSCLPSSVAGIYTEDSLLNATHYIDLQVNVTEAGPYVVKSDTVNGYSFYGEGDFTVTGLNNVRVFASGRPVNTGVNTFMMTYDSSVCSIDVTVNSGSTVLTAIYTLGAPGSPCSGVVLTGNYVAGTAMSVANTATINVNVTAIGAYTIITTAANGVTFSKVGSFTSTGAQQVTLNGYGTPVAGGTITHTINGMLGTCTFPVIYTAAFTLGGSTSAGCTGAVVAGTYTTSTALTAANTVTIQVNVTIAGPYSITTNQVNGMTFSKTGTFTMTGNQAVVLSGSGTPVNSGNTTFLMYNGPSGCAFTVPVNIGIPVPGDEYIRATVDGVFIEYLVNDTAYYPNPGALDISGFLNMSSGGFFSLGFDHYNAGDTLKAGTYTMAGSGYNTSPIPYQVDARYHNGMSWKPAKGPPYGTLPKDPWTFTILSIDSNRVTGTFSGIVRDLDGKGPNTKTITNGSYSVKF